MPTLTITRGLPGCGKTTHARAWVAEHPEGRDRVNRDDLRAMLHGGYGGPATERKVTAAAHTAITALLLLGCDVICDDTNLEPRHVDGLRAVADAAGAHLHIVDMRDVPVDVCLARNRLRTGTARLPDEVIERMHERWIAPSASVTP